jgi:ABC-type uncharacterized transport system substrate-binding protein
MKKTGLSSILIAVVLFAVGVIAEAQQPLKVPRIGFLSAVSPSSISPRTEAFRQGLRELGYVEGKSIVIEYRWAEGKFDRLPDLAAELVRLKVDGRKLEACRVDDRQNSQGGQACRSAGRAADKV